MKLAVIYTVLIAIMLIALTAVFVCLLRLIIKALKTYIRSTEVRKEKAIAAKSLGEVLKQHRTECKMTQEFVAEALGVSRQAVSKWESGASDPNTTNLIALAKLFGISPEELLKEAR
ncbi:MAG: helix-turn-helix transcriptional regulator [Clostridia bacterium]|nr:helix-turn-helix transcriptional regulator [Clostridia bacterium]